MLLENLVKRLCSLRLWACSLAKNLEHKFQIEILMQIQEEASNNQVHIVLLYGLHYGLL